MSLSAEIKQICREYQIKPLRRRGQIFLINFKIYAKIVEAAELNKNDTVLEIGAGLGHLTRQLAERVKKVIAVEIDKKLVNILKEQLKDYKNVEIVQEDILELQVTSYKLQDYKIVANIPYNITGIILRKFLSEKPRPKLIVLVLQKEVAQRICAQPPKMNLLSAIIQFYGQPKIIDYVSRNNFWPKPKVDSAILRIALPTNYSRPVPERTEGECKRITNINEEKFLKIVRAGFSTPRKYLLNNLAKKNIVDKEQGRRIFERLNLNQQVRAQELSVKDWTTLYLESRK